MVKGGPWVPVEIKIERDVDTDTGELAAPERLVAICNGQRRDPIHLWTYLTPIPREEHRAIIEAIRADTARAATHARFDLTEEIALP